MRISDHQPTLFGHEGYWSKIASADLHVAMFDVYFRKDDKLGRFTPADGSDKGFTAVLVSDVKLYPRIADMHLTQARKLRVSVETMLMNKRCPFSDRIEAFRDVIVEDAPYQKLWLTMVDCIENVVPFDTGMVLSKVPRREPTTFQRNLARIAEFHDAMPGDEYLCGPMVRNYVEKDTPCPMKLMMHGMSPASPASFVERIVREETPQLASPRIAPLLL